MPKLPKAKRRSWMPVKEKRYGQTDNSLFYQSKQWKMLRRYYIKSNPLCEMCNRQNKTTAAQCVDHIKPISLGGNKIAESNLQSLCNSCHAKKSAFEAVEYRKNIKDYKRKDKKYGRGC